MVQRLWGVRGVLPFGCASLDGDGKPEYAPVLCVGCGLCELYCPDLAVECLGEDGPGESGEGA